MSACSIKKRFEGAEGLPVLIEVLSQQELVENDQIVAKAFANSGELMEFAANESIVEQGGSDNCVYFILSGEVAVYINERFVALRERTCIGEMACIDPASTRSATVKAKTPVVSLKLSHAKFREVLDAHPVAYRAVAKLVAHRLRQRSCLYRPPNIQPILFVGCSVEGCSVAEELQLNLKHTNITTIPWTTGVFGPSSTPLQALLDQADKSDFAAFILRPDDEVKSRKIDSYAPRDNVIFELGLFIGKLGANRVFLIQASGSSLKIPTDLLGITPITYNPKPGVDLAVVLGPACIELKKSISKLGVR